MGRQLRPHDRNGRYRSIGRRKTDYDGTSGDGLPLLRRIGAKRTEKLVMSGLR